jgi:hypothetical protein
MSFTGHTSKRIRTETAFAYGGNVCILPGRFIDVSSKRNLLATLVLLRFYFKHIVLTLVAYPMYVVMINIIMDIDIVTNEVSRIKHLNI